MPALEYKSALFPLSIADANLLGADGWQLVMEDAAGNAWFSRPKVVVQGPPPDPTPVPVPTPPPPATGNAAQKAIGFYPRYANLANFLSKEAWLGHQMRYLLQMGDIRGESELDNSVWGEIAAQGKIGSIAGRLTYIQSVPLALGKFVDSSTAAGQATAKAQLQATANGDHDDAFTFVANTMKASGFSDDDIIRLGWEFDGSWMPWSAIGNEDLFIAAYRRAHDVFKSILPNIRFDWCGTAGFDGWKTTWTKCYPGDAYVDIIGMDVYPRGLSTTSKLLPILKAQRDFANAHGKKISFPEWALCAGGTAGGTGDDTAFIQMMFDAINAGPTEYATYFDEDVSDGAHSIDNAAFVKARPLFRQLFGATP